MDGWIPAAFTRKISSQMPAKALNQSRTKCAGSFSLTFCPAGKTITPIIYILWHWLTVIFTGVAFKRVLWGIDDFIEQLVTHAAPVNLFVGGQWTCVDRKYHVKDLQLMTRSGMLLIEGQPGFGKTDLVGNVLQTVAPFKDRPFKYVNLLHSRDVVQ